MVSRPVGRENYRLRRTTLERGNLLPLPVVFTFLYDAWILPESTAGGESRLQGQR